MSEGCQKNFTVLPSYQFETANETAPFYADGIAAPRARTLTAKAAARSDRAQCGHQEGR